MKSEQIRSVEEILSRIRNIKKQASWTEKMIFQVHNNSDRPESVRLKEQLGRLNGMQSALEWVLALRDDQGRINNKQEEEGKKLWKEWMKENDGTDLKQEKEGKKIKKSRA